jgi:hypothetical protein
MEQVLTIGSVGRVMNQINRFAGSLVGVAISLVVAKDALTQVSEPFHTPVRAFAAGTLFLAEDAPTPEAGDQIIAYSGDTVIGVFNFTTASAGTLQFRFLISGDDPETEEDEGPRRGDALTFGFYDSSTNSIRRDVQAWNSRTSEVTNVTFQGEEVLNIPGLPLDLTPTQSIDLVLGVGDINGGGGGSGTVGGDPDVNGDGKITREDAALVLRLVIGGGRGMTRGQIARADVNSDGRVSTADAIAVLRLQ